MGPAASRAAIDPEEDEMTITALTRRSGLARPRTSGAAARGDRRRAARDAAVPRQERRHRDGDRTDRYLDRDGVDFPLPVVAALWQR